MFSALTEQFFFLLQQPLKDRTEFFPAQILINARAGLPDSAEVAPVMQHAGMQRPLTASPGPSLMYSTTGILCIKNTMMIHDVHLDHITRYPPIFFFDFLPGQAQLGDHPFLIILIQRDGGFPLAAEAATGTGEDIRESVLNHR